MNKKPELATYIEAPAVQAHGVQVDLETQLNRAIWEMNVPLDTVSTLIMAILVPANVTKALRLIAPSQQPEKGGKWTNVPTLVLRVQTLTIAVGMNAVLQAGVSLLCHRVLTARITEETVTAPFFLSELPDLLQPADLADIRAAPADLAGLLQDQNRLRDRAQNTLIVNLPLGRSTGRDDVEAGATKIGFMIRTQCGTEAQQTVELHCHLKLFAKRRAQSIQSANSTPTSNVEDGVTCGKARHATLQNMELTRSSRELALPRKQPRNLKRSVLIHIRTWNRIMPSPSPC